MTFSYFITCTLSWGSEGFVSVLPQGSQDDSALCCCEYINKDKERSHLLATLCNCEAIDEAFER